MMKQCAIEVFCKTRSHWVHTNIILLAPEHSRWHEYVDSLLVTCLTDEALSADLHMALSELLQGEARGSWARGRGKKGAFTDKNMDELIV
eukprot:s1026_g6.t1